MGGIQWKGKDAEEGWRLLREAGVGAVEAEAAGLTPEGAGYASLEEMAGQLGRVEWLWPGWIPRGMVTILAAAPGMGKSLVALDVARRVLAGEAFPDGAPSGSGEGPGRTVVVVDAEGIPEVINERAEAWGMDRGRLYLMRPPRPAHTIDLADRRQMRVLVGMGRELRPALVVVDSLSTATAGGEASLGRARSVLTMLGALAQGLRAGMVVIHHLRKGTGEWGRKAGTAELRGTSQLSAAARSVVVMSAAGAGGKVRKLEVVKSNLCEPPAPLYVVVGRGEGGAPAVRYQATPPEEEGGGCVRWLAAYLAEAGPSRPAEVVAAGKAAGFSRATVYRARKALEGRVADGLEHGRRGTNVRLQRGAEG